MLPVECLPCTRAQASPVIDGWLDDPCWKDARPMYHHAIQQDGCDLLTRVCAGFDEQAVYLALDEGHGDLSGSSFVTRPRITAWNHFFRFVADATYNLGALPWLSSGRLKDKVLSRTFLSLGYYILAPQLQNGGRERSLNPFNPKYANVYLDLMVVY